MTIDVSAPGERAVDPVRQRGGRRRAATPVGEAFAAALLASTSLNHIGGSFGLGIIAGIKRKV
ncbi:MAG: hypothetical protein JNK01_12875 [Devosia sp.]|jgi:hypothetical protein|nr:hypothetical protein [Devosia sp.]